MTEQTLESVVVAYDGQSAEVKEFVHNAYQVLKEVEKVASPKNEAYNKLQEEAMSGSVERNLEYIEKLRGFIRGHLEGGRFVMARKNLALLILFTTHQSLVSLPQLLDTVVRKNINYGSSFDECVNEFGTAGAIIRLYDKGNRLRSLLSVDDLVTESVEDTLLDIAGYSLLTYVLVNEHPEYFKQKKKAGR